MLKKIAGLLRESRHKRKTINVYEDFVRYASRTERIGYLQRLIVNTQEALDKDTDAGTRQRQKLEALIVAARQEMARLYNNSNS